MGPLQPVFGARVRLARERLGLSQAEAARRVGLVSQAYGRLERGKALLSVPKLGQLCRVLSVSADALLQPGKKGQSPRQRKVPSAPAAPRDAEVQRLLALVQAWPLHRVRMLVRLVRTLDAACKAPEAQVLGASRVDTSSSR